MEQIRISKGIEVGVNDNGDSILLNVEDMNFAKRFAELIDKAEEIEKEISADINEDDSEAIVDFELGKMKLIMAEIDKFIGEGTCEKVFGADVIPTIYAVIDFFGQIIPIVTKYVSDRDAKLMKEYDPNRRGKKK